MIAQHLILITAACLNGVGNGCGQAPESGARVVEASFAQAPKTIVDTAQSAGSFSTLLAAAKAAGLVEALNGPGPITVFAPTDEAFGKLPKGTVENLLKPENRDALASILKYHVVPGSLTSRDVIRMSGAVTLNGQKIDFSRSGSSVMVDGAAVSSVDIACSNGIIHVVDAVLLPTDATIADVASSGGTFATLLSAAAAAGLEKELRGAGPITVFAPTDDAFAKLPAGTVDSLLKPENKAKLAEVLKYHIVPGRVYAADAAKAGVARTLQGQPLVFSIRNGTLEADGARITSSDIDASNGVVHVIDRVLLPG